MVKQLQSKDIDLLRIDIKEKKPSKYATLIRLSLLPCIAALLFLCLFGFNQFRITKLKTNIEQMVKENQTLSNQIANDPNAARYANYLSKLSVFESMITLDMNIRSYPELSLNTFDQILLAADLNVEVTSFTYARDSQVITLAIESSNANDTENFVRKLKTSNIFAAVGYNGYELTEKIIDSETDNDTDNNDNDNAGNSEDSDDTAKKIIDALTNKDASNDVTKQTINVYTATVQCVLKKVEE